MNDKTKDAIKAAFSDFDDKRKGNGRSSGTFAPLTPRGTGGGDAASVPTLGQWPLALLALLLGGMGFGAMRRKG